jgi:hypothetical protein
VLTAGGELGVITKAERQPAKSSCTPIIVLSETGAKSVLASFAASSPPFAAVKSTGEALASQHGARLARTCMCARRWLKLLGPAAPPGSASVESAAVVLGEPASDALLAWIRRTGGADSRVSLRGFLARLRVVRRVSRPVRRRLICANPALGSADERAGEGFRPSDRFGWGLDLRVDDG